MNPLDQEHGDQGCSNLDAQGILAGADETLDRECLLEGLEEDLDLPAFLVDRSDRGGDKIQMIGLQGWQVAMAGCATGKTVRNLYKISLPIEQG